MVTATIPQEAAAMTPGWLTSVLRDAGCIGDASIIGVQAETIGVGVGILCLLTRLTLEYDRPVACAPVTVIAKLPSPDAQTRAVAQAFHFYEREVCFYRDLAADIALAPPHCYFSAVDTASGDFVLLLEDLGAARLGGQVAGCTLDDARRALIALAETHAAWWNHPRLETLPWLPLASDPLNKAGLTLYGLAYPAFLERFGSRCAPEILALAERLEPYFIALLDAFSDGPVTLLHGDYRLDNLFFTKEAGAPPLRAIDWQIALRGLGTYDVGYFLSQSLPIELRRAHDVELLRLYHQTLCARGVTGYSFSDCLQHYRLTVLACLAYPVMGGGLADLANARAVSLAEAMIDRSSAAILDWNAGELMDELV